MPSRTLTEILAAPASYDGRSVEVAGLLMRWPEHGCVRDFDDEGEALWIDFEGSTGVAEFALSVPVFFRPVRVRGTYRHGPCGHLGGYPGQIGAITSLEAIPDDG